MYIKIPQGVYFRCYGDNVYLFDSHRWMSAFVKDAGLFKPLFSHHPVNIETVASRISDEAGIILSGVMTDIHQLIDPLLGDGYFVCGDQVEDVRTFADMRAQTQESYNGASETAVDDGADDREEAGCVLREYFLEHPTPFELCIDLTRACTERCVHCYVPNFQNVFLPFETIEKVLSEFAAMGGLKVKLTGGECMLHPDFERILKVARAHDLVISVLSNLTCCDESKAKAMKDVAVAVVQVSLYGMTPETHEAVTQVKGSLEKTLRGIRLLREVGVPVQIHCPVLKQNASGIEAVERFGREMGMKTTFDAVMMSRADHICSADCSLPDESLRQFIVSHEDLPSGIEPCPEATEEGHVCEIGTAKLCLSAEGKYYPCNGCYGLVLGDCRRQTLEEVWNAEPIKRLRQLRMRDLSKCRTCPNRMFCAPCPSRNFNANGDVTVPDASMCRAAACRREIVEDKRRGV